MEPVENHYAFAAAATPLALTARTSQFYGLCAMPSSGRSHHLQAKRCNRARIFALGSAPAPPPKEPEEDQTADVQSGDAAKPDADKPVEDVPTDPSTEVTADDILNSPTFLKKKLELVQKELISAKEKTDAGEEGMKEEKERYVRLAADFENYRRRSVEDLRQQDAKSTAKVCKEILTVLDNFERATTAMEPETDKERAIVSSYSAINKQLLDALAKLDVEPIDAVGQVFDPEFHEAIQRMDSKEFVEDVVCQQFSRGYKIGDVLIRAAIVAVSVGPGPEGSEENADEKAVEKTDDASAESEENADVAA